MKYNKLNNDDILVRLKISKMFLELFTELHESEKDLDYSELCCLHDVFDTIKDLEKILFKLNKIKK